jgi:hypothetical protein
LARAVPRAAMQQQDPLAPPAGLLADVADSVLANCGWGATMEPPLVRSATMAPAPVELPELRGRRARHPDRDRTLMGLRRAFAPTL